MTTAVGEKQIGNQDPKLLAVPDEGSQSAVSSVAIAAISSIPTNDDSPRSSESSGSSTSPEESVADPQPQDQPQYLGPSATGLEMRRQLEKKFPSIDPDGEAEQKYNRLIALLDGPTRNRFAPEYADEMLELEKWFIENQYFFPRLRSLSPRPLPAHTLSPIPLFNRAREIVNSTEPPPTTATTDQPDPYESFRANMRLVKLAAVVMTVVGLILGFNVSSWFFALAWGSAEIAFTAMRAGKGAGKQNPRLFQFSPVLSLLNAISFSQLQKLFIPPAQNPAESAPGSDPAEAPQD